MPPGSSRTQNKNQVYVYAIKTDDNFTETHSTNMCEIYITFFHHIKRTKQWVWGW